MPVPRRQRKQSARERADQVGPLYAAALGALHAETDGVIRLPMLGANSEEQLAEEDLRWSLPDWNALWAPWLPEDRWCHWEQVLASGHNCGRQV